MGLNVIIVGAIIQRLLTNMGPCLLRKNLIKVSKLIINKIQMMKQGVIILLIELVI